MATELIHPTAVCASAVIGSKTTIGPYSIVSPETTIGGYCSIGNSVRISGKVSIGNRVSLADGVTLTGPIKIEDDVHIGNNAEIGPDSASGFSKSPKTIVEAGAIIGANSRVFPGITIGIQALILEGSKVTTSVESYGVADERGRSLRRPGVVPVRKLDDPIISGVESANYESKVAGVELISLHEARDSRGTLLAFEMSDYLPFTPKRFFTVSSVPEQEKRGIHAHFRCHQFIVPIRGRVQVIVADGTHSEEYLLDSPKTGIYLPPLTWGTQHSFSHDAVILVLASERYERSDYIHHWDDFVQVKKSTT